MVHQTEEDWQSWIAIGIGVGAAMGAAMDDMGLWVALGVAGGRAAVGVGLDPARSRPSPSASWQ